MYRCLSDRGSRDGDDSFVVVVVVVVSAFSPSPRACCTSGGDYCNTSVTYAHTPYMGA